MPVDKQNCIVKQYDMEINRISPVEKKAATITIIVSSVRTNTAWFQILKRDDWCFFMLGC